MRVAITSLGKTYWLAGQPGVSEREFSSVSDFDKAPEINYQVDDFIRAPKVTVTDRLNLRTPLTFGTTRKFTTAEEAQVWSLDYERSYPRSGDVILEITKIGGGVTRRYLRNAVVLPPRQRVVGVSVILNYTVIGGDITPS